MSLHPSRASERLRIEQLCDAVPGVSRPNVGCAYCITLTLIPRWHEAGLLALWALHHASVHARISCACLLAATGLSICGYRQPQDFFF